MQYKFVIRIKKLRGVTAMEIKKAIALNSEDITSALNEYVDNENDEAFRELEQLYKLIEGTLEELDAVKRKIQNKASTVLNQELQRELTHIFDSVKRTYDMYHLKAVGKDFKPYIEKRVIHDINEKMRTLGFSEKTIISRQSVLNQLTFENLDEIRDNLPNRNTVMEHKLFKITTHYK